MIRGAWAWLPALLAAACMTGPLGAGVEAAGFSTPGGDPLVRLLGSAREALGDLAYLQADVYFHGGLSIRQAEEHHDEHEGHAGERAASDWAGRIYDHVRPVVDRHLEGEEERELLPILDAAVRLNPRNVQAVLTQAYWFQDRRFSDPAHALSILEKGLKDNPGSWEIESVLGRLLLDRGDPARAAALLGSAVRNMGEDAVPFDAVRVRYDWARALEKTGDRPAALAAVREALARYPTDHETALKETLRRDAERLSQG